MINKYLQCMEEQWSGIPKAREFDWDILIRVQRMIFISKYYTGRNKMIELVSINYFSCEYLWINVLLKCD